MQLSILSADYKSFVFAPESRNDIPKEVFPRDWPMHKRSAVRYFAQNGKVQEGGMSFSVNTGSLTN